MIGFSRHTDVERHFSGAASPADDRRMWKHVKGCARCRDQYRTLSMLEELEAGGGDRARARLARGVFATETARPRRVIFGAGLATAFAAFALMLTVGGKPASFQARGGLGGQEAPMPVLSIYRVPRDASNPERLAVGEAHRAGSVMHAGESLAFAYANPAQSGVGDGYLMVFGLDAAGHVYWFWPAWNDAAEDPASLPIQTSAAPVELTEAVRHPLSPGPLTIVGLFTPHPLHVRQVEAAVASGLQGLHAFPGHLWTETLEVTP